MVDLGQKKVDLKIRLFLFLPEFENSSEIKTLHNSPTQKFELSYIKY
ncbi:hypothetical protein SAMN05660903_00418 [Salegentibacter salinarum]|nr:hypothetical protein SAMN05660903_00418 [Salegentibacter salinarum]